MSEYTQEQIEKLIRDVKTMSKSRKWLVVLKDGKNRVGVIL